MNESALVSIGIPCYNRANLIARAIESALGQDYANIEVIISDNASTDDTEEVCRAFAARDERVVYIRQETNRGASANFEEVFQQSRGEYFLWLGDDDWFDKNYVFVCVGFLEKHPDYVAAYGRALYYQGDELIWDRAGFSLPQEQAIERVAKYYAQVEDNGLFYGVFRREALQKANPIPNVMAGDWMFMAKVVFQGKVAVLDATKMHRVLGGVSASYEKIVQTLGLPPFYARIFMLRVGWEAWRDIMQAPVYKPLGRMGQWRLALRCQPCFLKRHLVSVRLRFQERFFLLSHLPLMRPVYELARQIYRFAKRIIFRRG
jgi:glycosyltransferase domain-containing protein